MPCLPYTIADCAVNQSGRVENNRSEFCKINLTFGIKNALISTPIHDLTNHTCTAIGIFFHFNNTALQRELVFVDYRGIHIWTWS